MISQTTNRKLKWIVLEGPDKSGKTTISDRLVQLLIDRNRGKYDYIFLASEPINECVQSPFIDKYSLRGHLRKAIRDNIKSNKLLGKKELLCNFLEDRALLLSTIRQYHDTNALIIQDRSYVSTLVYQHIYAELSQEYLMYLNNCCFDAFYPEEFNRPDAFIYISTPIETIKSRYKCEDCLDEKFLQNIKSIHKSYESLFQNNRLYLIDTKLKELHKNKLFKGIYTISGDLNLNEIVNMIYEDFLPNILS